MKKLIVLFSLVFLSCSFKEEQYREIFLELAEGTYALTGHPATIDWFNTEVANIINAANPSNLVIKDEMMRIERGTFTLKKVRENSWAIYSFDVAPSTMYIAVNISANNEVIVDKNGAVADPNILGKGVDGYIISMPKRKIATKTVFSTNNTPAIGYIK